MGRPAGAGSPFEGVSAPHHSLLCRHATCRDGPGVQRCATVCHHGPAELHEATPGLTALDETWLFACVSLLTDRLGLCLLSSCNASILAQVYYCSVRLKGVAQLSDSYTSDACTAEKVLKAAAVQLQAHRLSEAGSAITAALWVISTSACRSREATALLPEACIRAGRALQRCQTCGSCGDFKWHCR